MFRSLKTLFGGSLQHIDQGYWHNPHHRVKINVERMFHSQEMLADE